MNQLSEISRDLLRSEQRRVNRSIVGSRLNLLSVLVINQKTYKKLWMYVKYVQIVFPKVCPIMVGYGHLGMPARLFMRMNNRSLYD